MAPDIRYVRVAWNIDADRYSAHHVSPSPPLSVYGKRARARVYDHGRFGAISGLEFGRTFSFRITRSMKH